MGASHYSMPPATSDDAYPASFICSITREVMKDPVMDLQGNSYERAAILDWLSRNGSSPITRSPLRPSDLVPNRALKDAIDAFTVGAKTKPAKLPKLDSGNQSAPLGEITRLDAAHASDPSS